MGLMKNDEIIGAGHRAFAKMARDQAGSSAGAIEIDKLYLQQVESRLVHNLQVVDKMLGDQQRFPANPLTADERDTVMMKTQLQAVADVQRKALDIVSGTLATESLGQMQHEFNTGMQSAIGTPGPPVVPTDDPVSFIGAAGLPDESPNAGLPTTAAKTSSLGGHTVYDGMAAVIESQQGTIARRERVATASILTAVDDCRAGTAPAPAATSSPAP